MATEILNFFLFQTHITWTFIAITKDNSLEIQSGYQGIKHTLILLPAATKHVTILLCAVLEALSNYDRRSRLFPWVSALITALLLALPHLYKCQSKVHLFLWKIVPTKKPITLIVSQQNNVMQNPCISDPPTCVHFFFFFCMPSSIMLTITFLWQFMAPALWYPIF